MAKTDSAPHLLVVIDHQEAKVYRTEVHGAIPVSIASYDPHGYRKHLHSAHEWTDGSASQNGRVSMRPSPRRCLEPSRCCYSGAARAEVVRWRC